MKKIEKKETRSRKRGDTNRKEKLPRVLKRSEEKQVYKHETEIKKI